MWELPSSLLLGEKPFPLGLQEDFFTHGLRKVERLESRGQNQRVVETLSLILFVDKEEAKF